MNRIGFDVNLLWFYAVAAHLAGSVVFGIMEVLPFGSIICLTGLWGIAYTLSDKKTKNIQAVLIGWILTLIILLIVPAGYRSSFLMNGLMLILIYEVCRQRKLSIFEYCRIKKISLGQWGVLLLLTAALFIVAAYVNAISLLFVHNMTAAALMNAKEYLADSIIIYAVIPAIVEEMFFRGCIYRGIANKKTAVIISAVMFALLHMNFNQMSYAFVMGLFFAALIVITDNLSVSISIHLLFNGMNIAAANFPNSLIISSLSKINVAGYQIFAPQLLMRDGTVNVQAIAAGSIIAFAAVLGIAALLYYMYKQKDGADKYNNKEIIQNKDKSQWKANRTFWAGCAACVIIALAYEILL